METIKSFTLLTRPRHRCESGNPSTRSNLGFTDTSSLESIFTQLGVSPPKPSKGTESVNRIRATNSSEPRILKVARKSFDTLDVGKTRPHERHLKINPELLAQQITLIELKLFKAIEPEEFLSLKWNSKEKLKYAPNIVASTRWFNQIIFWVQKDILNEENLSRRAEVLSHFVRIAKKLTEVNNFSSAMAIVSGLLVQSVYRLSATWAALPSRDRSTFRKLADLFSQDQNFVTLRTAIDTARLPCIPYLGIYLSDLTYIDVAGAAAAANQQENSGSWGSQGKQDRLNNVIRIITNFQQSIYPFVRDEKIACYLEAQRYIEELQRFIEDNNYKLSLRLEPPAPDTYPSQLSDSTYPFPVKPTWFASSVLKPVPVPSSTSETGPPTVATGLDRRPALVPHGTSFSLGEVHSVQSSPAGSSARLRPSPTDQALPTSHTPHVGRQNSSAGRGRTSPLFEDYLFGCSSGRPLPGQHTATSHRRMGSWTGVVFDANSGNDDHLCAINSLFKELSPRMRHCGPNAGYASWSTSSSSTGRSLLVMDQPVPVQQPLGPLLDQTDLVPSALSPTVPMVQSNHDPVNSSLFSSGDPTDQTCTKSTYPKALGVILPSLTKVYSIKPVSQDRPRAAGSIDSGSGRSRDSSEPTERHETASLTTAHGNSDPKSAAVSPTQLTGNRTRLHHSVSQPRLDRSIVDKRRRKTPVELEQKHSPPQQQSKQLSCHGSATLCSLRKIDHDTTRVHQTDSIPFRSKFSTECSPGTCDLQSDRCSTVLTPPTGDCRPASPSGSLAPIHACPSLTKDGSSTSDTSSSACSHSSFLANPPLSPSHISSQVDAGIASSHLAQAALAAVEGTIADELARLSARERRSSVSNPNFRPHSLISSVKAVCLDVQFANNLSVLREGVVVFSRSSSTAFKKAQQSKLFQPHGELNNTATTFFGSCDALDTLRQRPDMQSKWNASFAESTTQHINLEVSDHITEQLSVSLLTPSPSHSLSQASLASFVLDLPSPSSAVSSSSSLWGSSVPSLVGSPPPANPHTRQASHSTPSRYSPCGTTGPYNYLEHCMTAPEKRRILSWFRHFRCRSHYDTKLRWGVLIQSNTFTSNHVFLVLFKLHRTVNYHQTRCSVGQLAASAAMQPNPKCIQNPDGSGWRSSLPQPQITYTPEMFSASHFQLLCIGAVIVDDCSLTRIPTVLVSDLMGPKLKIYRLSPVSHIPLTSSTQSSEDPHDLLATMFQRGCDANRGNGDQSHAGSVQRPAKMVYRDSALRLPLTNLRKARAALRSLRRLWPATWTAARRRNLRRDMYPRKDKSSTTDHSTPNATPTSQSSLNGPDLDQTGTESYLALLPLLSLFPDQHPKH